MKAIVHGFHTEIFPSKEDTDSLCKIGQGRDTCIFLLLGPEGFECHGLNQGPIMFLIERARRGGTSAQREGCETVLNWVSPGIGEQNIKVSS